MAKISYDDGDIEDMFLSVAFLYNFDVVATKSFEYKKNLIIIYFI